MSEHENLAALRKVAKAFADNHAELKALFEKHKEAEMADDATAKKVAAEFRDIQSPKYAMDYYKKCGSDTVVALLDIIAVQREAFSSKLVQRLDEMSDAMLSEHDDGLAVMQMAYFLSNEVQPAMTKALAKANELAEGLTL